MCNDARVLAECALAAVEVTDVLHDLEQQPAEKSAQVPKQLDGAQPQVEREVADAALQAAEALAASAAPPAAPAAPVTANAMPAGDATAASSAAETAAAPAAPAQAPRAQLVEGEAMETGKVSARVYWTYITAIGRGVFALFLVIGVLSAALGVKVSVPSTAPHSWLHTRIKPLTDRCRATCG